MTLSHLHLLLNHVPVLGTYFGLASLLLAVFVGIRSAFALFSLRRKGRLSGYNMVSLLILAALMGILMGWTASIGGKIRRPEIRYSESSVSEERHSHSVWKVPSRSVRS